MRKRPNLLSADQRDRLAREIAAWEKTTGLSFHGIAELEEARKEYEVSGGGSPAYKSELERKKDEKRKEKALAQERITWERNTETAVAFDEKAHWPAALREKDPAYKAAENVRCKETTLLEIAAQAMTEARMLTCLDISLLKVFIYRRFWERPGFLRVASEETQTPTSTIGEHLVLGAHKGSQQTTEFFGGSIRRHLDALHLMLPWEQLNFVNCMESTRLRNSMADKVLADASKRHADVTAFRSAARSRGTDEWRIQRAFNRAKYVWVDTIEWMWIWGELDGQRMGANVITPEWLIEYDKHRCGIHIPHPWKSEHPALEGWWYPALRDELYQRESNRAGNDGLQRWRQDDWKAFWAAGVESRRRLRGKRLITVPECPHEYEGVSWVAPENAGIRAKVEAKASQVRWSRMTGEKPMGQE